MNVYSINTGYFKLDGGAMFGVVPKSIWQNINPADSNNMCSWALRCMLIHDGDRLTLVDTGMGNKQDDKFFGHYNLHGTDTLDKSLAQHGFCRADVTDVLLTHLHFDHCGGAIVKGDNDALQPAFINATYWSNTQHWQSATQPNAREKASFLAENILPIQASGQLKFIDTDANHFPPNITIRQVFGHTEAMMLPQVVYKNRTILYMADLLPSAGHIPLPYVMAYDMYPATTLTEKSNFLTEALQNDYVLFFEHDPHIECCTLQLTNKGIRLKDSFKLSDL